jgi:hypothetical protein
VIRLQNYTEEITRLSSEYSARRCLFCVGLTISLSIVAVHGLHGGAFKTWTTKSGKFWLKDPDMLPACLKQSRILTFSYNATAASIGGKASSERILHHAHTLVAELSGNREVRMNTSIVLFQT